MDSVLIYISRGQREGNMPGQALIPTSVYKRTPHPTALRNTLRTSEKPGASGYVFLIEALYNLNLKWSLKAHVLKGLVAS
jgi:hypothetical protein